MAAGDWLRGRPDPALTDFWLDPTLPGLTVDELVGRARAEWAGAEEWAPGLAALGWRGTPEVLDALRGARGRRRIPWRAASPPTSPGSWARRCGRSRRPPRRCWRGWPPSRRIRPCSRSSPRRWASSARPGGSTCCSGCAATPTPAVRDGVVDALAGRTDPAAVAALVELSRDAEPAIRDWATFALGTLTDQDSPELRDALVARLDDGDAEARIEAVHGLALRARPARGRARAGAAGGRPSAARRSGRATRCWRRRSSWRR